MARRSFPVYDFAVFGFKGMLKHFRVFVLTTLGFIGTVMAAMGILALPFYRLIQRLVEAGSDLRYDLMTCVNKQECFGTLGRTYQKVWPMMSQFKVIFVVVSIVFFIIVLWLGTGMLRILLKLYDKDKASARELWGTFRFVPRFFVAGILFLLVIGVGVTVIAAPGYWLSKVIPNYFVGHLLSSLLAVLAVLFGLWLVLRLFFWKFYIIDKDMGVIDCMRASFAATQGIEWHLFALLALGVSLIAVFPPLGLYIFSLMVTAAYRKIEK